MNSGDHGTAAWSSPAWLERATSWLDERLAEAGSTRTGDVEQPHLRPWATVLRVPTSRGTVWLKAVGPGTAFEVGLYQLLERVAPERVLRPLALDADRGWMLLPDGGRPLGEHVRGEDLVDALAAVLPAYGQLQRDLAPRAGELLALGVHDMRPEAMPRRFDEALEAARGYAEHRGSAADRTALEQVAGLRETVVSWCHSLAAAPGAPTLDHNDLHPWNILVGDGEGAARARFYDWGDSVVAHPFASMLLALAFVEPEITVEDLHRLRDAYLEVFTELGSRAELVEALELACRVGKIARALTWHRAIGALGPDLADPDWMMAPITCMVSLLDDTYLVRA